MKELQKTLAIALLATGSAAVQATVISEIESNDTLATAQNINPYFSLDFNANIGDTTTNTSLVIPHVTIQGTGNNTYDVYAFTTTGGRAIFDVDFGRDNPGGLSDPYLHLFDFSGASMTANDDNSISYGQDGSIHPYDSYIELANLAAGDYFIRVGRCCESEFVNGTYELQVSIENHPLNQNQPTSVPEPTSIALLGVGAMSMVAARRRKNV